MEPGFLYPEAGFPVTKKAQSLKSKWVDIFAADMIYLCNKPMWLFDGIYGGG